MKIFSKNKDIFLKTVEAVFQVSFVSFLALFAIDYIFPGFVSNWFNSVWLLILSFFCIIIIIAKD